MKFKAFANPYYLFSIVWAISIYYYSLGWTSMYPTLKISLYSFVLCCIIANISLGFIFHKIVLAYKVNIKRIIRLDNIMLFNLLLWLVNFIYSGVPLFNILIGRDFDHLISFGIPTVVVFLISFNGFLCLLTIHYFFEFKKRKYLLYYIINITFFMLIFSRGSVMFVLLGSFFLWLFDNNKAISIKSISTITISFLLVLYLFGVAGNYRAISEINSSYGQSENGYNSKAIMAIAQPSQSFLDNIVPNEYMWGYLYLTSPIGNLQESINRADINVNFRNITAYFINEFTFDFISKRVQSAFNLPKYITFMFAPALSVPTTFAEAYLYLGWLGMVFYQVAMLIFPVMYFFLIRRFPTWKVGMSVLCCIYFFSIFDNMFTYSGLGLQLFYPFIFFSKNSS